MTGIVGIVEETLAEVRVSFKHPVFGMNNRYRFEVASLKLLGISHTVKGTRSLSLRGSELSLAQSFTAVKGGAPRTLCAWSGMVIPGGVMMERLLCVNLGSSSDNQLTGPGCLYAQRRLHTREASPQR
jgi:hypothetical protein